MVNQNLVHVLSLMMIFTSFAAVEARNLRHATVAYCCQALLVCGLLAAYSVQNHALIYWALTALITKAILVPWFLWNSTKDATEETKPIISFGVSAVLVLIVLGLMYWFVQNHAGLVVDVSGSLASLAATNLAVAFTVFALGVYAILTRRDAIKTVIGLCLLENGVHLSLVSLAPTIKETALAGIATEVVVTVWILLYIIGGVREKFATTDTFELSELHW